MKKWRKARTGQAGSWIWLLRSDPEYKPCLFYIFEAVQEVFKAALKEISVWLAEGADSITIMHLDPFRVSPGLSHEVD